MNKRPIDPNSSEYAHDIYKFLGGLSPEQREQYSAIDSFMSDDEKSSTKSKSDNEEKKKVSGAEGKTIDKGKEPERSRESAAASPSTTSTAAVTTETGYHHLITDRSTVTHLNKDDLKFLDKYTSVAERELPPHMHARAFTERFLYSLSQSTKPGGKPDEQTMVDELQRLARKEHDRWMETTQTGN